MSSLHKRTQILLVIPCNILEPKYFLVTAPIQHGQNSCGASRLDIVNASFISMNKQLTIRNVFLLSKGCSIEKVLLIIMATPPEISINNIDEIMRSLGTPSINKHHVSQHIATSVYTKNDALHEVICEWVARKSINATMEVLIYDLKRCYLNSYADALELHFTRALSRKNSITSELDDIFSVDNDCQLTVNSDQPFIPPNGMETFQLEEQPYKVRYKLCISPCLVITLMSLTATLFVIMLQNFGLGQKNKPLQNASLYDANVLVPINSNSTETTGFILTNFTSGGLICPTANEIVAISVTSYHDFQQKTSDISKCDSISLHVDLVIKDAWPIKPNITPTSRIIDISLSGSFGIGKVMEILQSVPTISVLRLNNSRDKLCSENSHHNSLLQHVRDCNVDIPDLQHLHLHNFVNCEYILDMILTCLKPRVSVFEFDGKITDANSQQIFHIMEGSRNTLKEIKISGSYATSLSILPFHTTMHSLSKLSIVVEPTSQQFKNTTIISEHFCKVLSRINTFVLKGLIATYEQLLYLQNCKELSEITVGVNLQATDDIEVLNIAEWFPLLTRLNIELTFEECPDAKMSDIFIRKIQLIRQTCVCSNCDISKNLRRGSKSTVKKCLRRNSIV